MRFFIDLMVYFCTLVGYIPSHTIRLFLYRYIFRIKIGKNSSIHWRAEFNKPSGVMIGHNTVIGNNAFFDGRSKRLSIGKSGLSKWLSYIHDLFHPQVYPLIIGSNVSIAGEVRVYTMEHNIQSSNFEEIGSPVVIEDYVVIGTRVTILPGVTIRKGAVVASGAVVTKNVDEYTIVGGVPAKYISNRTKDLRYSLKYSRLFQ